MACGSSLQTGQGSWAVTGHLQHFPGGSHRARRLTRLQQYQQGRVLSGRDLPRASAHGHPRRLGGLTGSAVSGPAEAPGVAAPTRTRVFPAEGLQRPV